MYLAIFCILSVFACVFAAAFIKLLLILYDLQITTYVRSY